LSCPPERAGAPGRLSVHLRSARAPRPEGGTADDGRAAFGEARAAAPGKRHRQARCFLRIRQGSAPQLAVSEGGEDLGLGFHRGAGGPGEFEAGPEALDRALMVAVHGTVIPRPTAANTPKYD